MPIRDWPPSERPRERLIREGPAALSDAELLTLFIRTGIPGSSALDLARDLLSRFGGLSGILGASAGEFTDAKGLGMAKYAQLQAVLEMTKRTLGESLRRGPVLGNTQAVREYVVLELGRLPFEVFFALFLDGQNCLLTATELFRGTLTHTSVYPREVVKAALVANAASIVFAHNHPSGIPVPSRADELLTKALVAALDLVDIRTLDHLIVAGNRVFSFAEAGRM